MGHCKAANFHEIAGIIATRDVLVRGDAAVACAGEVPATGRVWRHDENGRAKPWCSSMRWRRHAIHVTGRTFPGASRLSRGKESHHCHRRLSRRRMLEA